VDRSIQRIHSLNLLGSMARMTRSLTGSVWGNRSSGPSRGMRVTFDGQRP
jgi:hypothetical protein